MTKAGEAREQASWLENMTARQRVPPFAVTAVTAREGVVKIRRPTRPTLEAMRGVRTQVRHICVPGTWRTAL